MSLDPKNASKTFPRVPEIPAGMHQARIFAIIDTGHQVDTFNGQERIAIKLDIGWETVNVVNYKMKDEHGNLIDKKRPGVVWQTFTYSSDQKSNLVKMIMSLRGLNKPPETLILKDLMDADCTINVTYSTSGEYSVIANKGTSVMPPMDPTKRFPIINDPSGARYNPSLYFDLDNFSWELFDRTPKFIQDKITKSQEWPQIAQKFPRAVSQQQNFGTQPTQSQNQTQSFGQAPTQGLSPNTNFAQQQFQTGNSAQQTFQSNPSANDINTGFTGELSF